MGKDGNAPKETYNTAHTCVVIFTIYSVTSVFFSVNSISFIYPQLAQPTHEKLRGSQLLRIMVSTNFNSRIVQPNEAIFIHNSIGTCFHGDIMLLAT